MSAPLAFIIEDNPEHTLYFRKLLQATEYEIASASDGQQAIDYLQDHVPHLILLDFHLPVMNGLDVLAHIQASSQLDETTVIIVTADVRFNSYPHERADFVFPKPAGYKQLRDLVKRVRSG